MAVTKNTPAALIRDFFGLLPGETATQGGPDNKGFMGEYRTLTDADKRDLTLRIAAQRGIPVADLEGLPPA